MAAACSGGGFGGMLPNWFARNPQTPISPAAAAFKPLDEDCPTVDIRTGAGTLQIVNNPQQQPTAMDLRYQLTFHETARECMADASTVRMRVGVQGRAVVGPAGSPPEISVPLRYAVVREGVQPKTIVTKFRRIPLQVPPNTANVMFTDIEEDLTFPRPPLAELQAYVVYVGFDDKGDRVERPPPPQKKKKSKAPSSKR
jgi:hypothetical protein